MGDLLTFMVGLRRLHPGADQSALAPQVFTESTFTRAGLRIIRKTTTLQQILARNIDSPADAVTRFTYRPERRSSTHGS